MTEKVIAALQLRELTMKNLQWWLHGASDKITIFYTTRSARWIGRKLAFCLANWLDRIAMRVGGNTW